MSQRSEFAAGPALAVGLFACLSAGAHADESAIEEAAEPVVEDAATPEFSLAELAGLVQEATATVERFQGGEAWTMFLDALQDAHGVVVAPDMLKAGLIIGGEAGRGLLLVRDVETGSWGYPAFVELSSGSVGWQIGVQVAEVVLIVRTEGGLERLLGDSIMMGVDAGIAVATTGTGIEGGTTTNLDADIVALALPRGAFAGITLKGAVLSVDADSNAAFYGPEASLEDIVEGRAGHELAEPLRVALTGLPPVPDDGS